MGTLRWENEDVYEGCFVHGGIAGRGTFTVGSDGTEYSGFFGVAPDVQTKDNEKGEEEEGEAEATGDVPTAAALTTAPSADELVPVPDAVANAAPTEPPMYDHAGLLTGHGEITWPDGRVYRGPFRAGRPLGSECELEMPPTSARRPSRAAGGPRPGRDAYLGELSWDGWPEGRGTCTFAAGGVYEGAWAGGRPQGEGILRRAGEEYTGAFNSGQPEGHGRLVRVDGSVYTGAFRRGAPDGEGELVEVDGRRHVGTFRRGEKHGRGRVALGADAVFEGWYCRGKRDGRGVTTSPGGERLEARYVDDELRGPSRFFHRAPAPPARKARPPAPRPQLLSFEMRWQCESAPRTTTALAVARAATVGPPTAAATAAPYLLSGAPLAAFLRPDDRPVRVLSVAPRPRWLVERRAETRGGAAPPPPPVVRAALRVDGGTVRLGLAVPPRPAARAMLWSAIEDDGGVPRVRIEVYALAQDRMATAHDVVVGSEVRVAPLLEWEPRRE